MAYAEKPIFKPPADEQLIILPLSLERARFSAISAPFCCWPAVTIDLIVIRFLFEKPELLLSEEQFDSLEALVPSPDPPPPEV